MCPVHLGHIIHTVLTKFSLVQEGSRGFGVRAPSPCPVGQQTGNKPHSGKRGAAGVRYQESRRGGSALRRGGGRDPRRSCGMLYSFDESDDETFRKQDDGLKVGRGGGRSRPTGTRPYRGNSQYFLPGSRSKSR